MLVINHFYLGFPQYIFRKTRHFHFSSPKTGTFGKKTGHDIKLIKALTTQQNGR
jgi:hypothetical protein